MSAQLIEVEELGEDCRVGRAFERFVIELGIGTHMHLTMRQALWRAYHAGAVYALERLQEALELEPPPP